MIERILCLPDLHRRMQDITTLKGYRDVNKQVVKDIISIIPEYKITKIFGLGDLFDSGYSAEVNLALLDVSDIMQMRDLVNGEFYEVIGNHVNKKMSSNPELYLIQPNEKYKMKENQDIKEQKIKTPDYLNINGANIYFQHWDWQEQKPGANVSMYKPKLKEGTCNIALFHSTLVIPKRYLRGAPSNDEDIVNALEGIDYAICGHIHQPIGSFIIGNTQMIIPGSLTNTDSGSSFHKAVNLPIIVIDESGSVNIEYVMNFNIHAENIDVVEKKGTDLLSLRSRKLKDFDNDVDLETKILSTIAWLKQRKDRSDYDIKICEIIAHTPDKVTDIISTYRQMSSTSNLNIF